MFVGLVVCGVRHTGLSVCVCSMQEFWWYTSLDTWLRPRVHGQQCLPSSPWWIFWASAPSWPSQRPAGSTSTLPRSATTTFTSDRIRRGSGPEPAPSDQILNCGKETTWQRCHSRIWEHTESSQVPWNVTELPLTSPRPQCRTWNYYVNMCVTVQSWPIWDRKSTRLNSSHL